MKIKRKYISEFKFYLLKAINKVYRKTYKQGNIIRTGRPNSRQNRSLNQIT